MANSFYLYQSETDDYINDEFIERIVTGITRQNRFSTLTALFAPVRAPRCAIINRCRERATHEKTDVSQRKVFWLEPFRAWDMFSIGNLSLALLWHIYRSLPHEAAADEKIIYKLGKISLTLPALTDGIRKNAGGYCHEPDRHNAITSKAFPADRKSSISSIFSACEQITELSEAFHTIGAQIAASGKFDAMVIPVVDIDQCLPEQAISLLFAIRNFICCDTISFLVAADDSILSRFFISLYDNSLTTEQARSTLLSLFDDWAYLPPPSVEKMIQHIDKKLVKKECDYILSKINGCGILACFSDYDLLHHGFNRFNLFKNNMLQQYSIEELALCLLLFLLGSIQGALLKNIALRPDIEQLIAAIRADEKSAPGNGTIILQPTTAPHLNSNSLFPALIRTVPASITEADIARWIVRIVPYI